jgi:xylulokinase
VAKDIDRLKGKLTAMFVLGLDVGTQGARAIVCDGAGVVRAQAAETFASPELAELLPPGWVEQDPREWWTVVSSCLRKVLEELRWSGSVPQSIKAIAVDSTSGTIVPVDSIGNVVRSAIMYSDARAVLEAEECNAVATNFTAKLGYKFTPAFGLPKILWIKRNEPQVFEQTACFLHPADYIVGRLTGSFRLTDTSNALKTGYDLIDGCWPEFIEKDLGIPIEKLPHVVSPGTTIGVVSRPAAQETGLAPGTPVVAGVTDGTAGFLASGAAKVGDWNSTIGTTLVVRGISKSLIKDPLGRVYCHVHPQGYWLPGGASNVGAECLTKLFSGRNFSELNAYVPQYSPTSLIVYPLVRKGERFPFVNPMAEGFVIGEPRDSRELYTAYLEGVGYVERWCIELLAELGAEVGDTIYTTGGAAKSIEWMQVRSNILNRRVVRPLTTECAMGTAVVAASKTLFPDLESAVKAMIKPGEAVEPEPQKAEIYDYHYRGFRDACARRGYV